MTVANQNDMDPLMYAMLVFVDAQNKDQLCMEQNSELLKWLSESGSNAVDAGTAILQKDNEAIQNTSDHDALIKLQSQQQSDNTKINNANQQYSNLQQSMETQQTQLSQSDQNETEFMKSFLDVYSNVTSIIASR